jgi:membrane-anchored mycosin MYCP
MIRAVRLGLRATAAGCAALLLMSPAAWAIAPPSVEPGVAPPSGSPGANPAMQQQGGCVYTGVLPGSDPDSASASQTMLNLPDAWRFSRGAGQTVAVIDTGVTPGPRLNNVDGGGDFVGNTDGLTDCDGHGTLVAGIIAGQPSGDDAFSGVAPEARILSIRQTSARFALRIQGGDPAIERASADISALARAIVHAADSGARVINISSVTCLPADNPVDQAALGAALRYAAVDKDAVVVAAAGNDTGPDWISGGQTCHSNPINRASNPEDTRNWAGVHTISAPSWWQPYVLSVGSLTPTGQPSKFTMSGPWVGIAGPGEQIVSVSNGEGGALANGVPTDRGTMRTVDGTSFAAAYVSGVAALVRSRFPELPAHQVVQRLKATAHNGARDPSNLVGAGTVDPVAALTWDLPATDPSPRPSTQIAAPVQAPPENHTPRNIALAGTAVLALAVAGTAYAVNRRKERSQ